jgi:hypothetical protein
VAEEVERAYPELVTHDANGKVETVRYSMLSSMLLNELQKQARENHRQGEQIRELSAQLAQTRAAMRTQAAQLVELRTAFDGRLAIVEQAMRTSGANRRLAASFNR